MKALLKSLLLVLVLLASGLPGCAKLGYTYASWTSGDQYVLVPGEKNFGLKWLSYIRKNHPQIDNFLSGRRPPDFFRKFKANNQLAFSFFYLEENQAFHFIRNRKGEENPFTVEQRAPIAIELGAYDAMRGEPELESGR